MTVVEETEKLALEEIEVRLLTEGIYRHYGFDFRDYSLPSLRRRIWKRVYAEGLSTISGLQEKVLHDCAVHGAAAARPLHQHHRHVPRPDLLPRLPAEGRADAAHVSVRAHLARRLFDRRRGLLDGHPPPGRGAVRPLPHLRHGHQRGGAAAREGRHLPAGHDAGEHRELHRRGRQRGRSRGYYTARYDYAIFRPSLRENVVFAQHNLVTDASFNHFNVIFCRNVLIYFNNALQDRVQQLFLTVMEMFGILGLGKKETIRYTSVADRYEEIDAEERLYRRIR